MATTHQHGGNRVLVLGATGGIGSEVAGALRARGWAVRAMHRRGAPPGGGGGGGAGGGGGGGGRAGGGGGGGAPPPPPRPPGGGPA